MSDHAAAVWEIEENLRAAQKLLGKTGYLSGKIEKASTPPPALVLISIILGPSGERWKS